MSAAAMMGPAVTMTDPARVMTDPAPEVCEHQDAVIDGATRGPADEPPAALTTTDTTVTTELTAVPGFPEYEAHPAAAIFPMMGDADLAALAEDIREHGLREPIVLHDDKIVDGRNRYAGCRLAGVVPRFRDWKGEGSVVRWVLSANLHRRHLTDQQRAMVAAKAKAAYEAEAEGRRIANLLQNKASTVSADLRSRTPEGSENGKSAAKAAKDLGVAPRAVEQAAKILRKGDDSLVAAVQQGTVSLDAAATVSRLPRAEQKRLVQSGNVKSAAARLRLMRGQEKMPEPTRTTGPEQSPTPPVAPAPAAPRDGGVKAMLDQLPEPRRTTARALFWETIAVFRVIASNDTDAADLALDGLRAFVRRTTSYLRGEDDGDFLREVVEPVERVSLLE